jgi:ABC-type glycerol-3-phosphate transport system permease component
MGRALTCASARWRADTTSAWSSSCAPDGDADAAEDRGGGVSEPDVVRAGNNILFNTHLHLENFARVFDGGEFWSVLGVTLFYTFFGTIGAPSSGPFRGAAAGP